MDTLHSIECEELMKFCLKNLSEDKTICDMEYPNFRTIKVKIVGLKLDNPYWKPVHVKILEKGLQKEEVRWRDSKSWGMDDEPQQESYTVQVPVKDEWVQLHWLKNYRKDESSS